MEGVSRQEQSQKTARRRMIKDEMKCRISMALKDPILQQGFEIICKENAELKSIADFQTSSNMDRYFQLIRSKERLTEAKEIIKKLLKTPRTVYKKDEDGEVCPYVNEEYSAIEKQAEQFLSEAINKHVEEAIVSSFKGVAELGYNKANECPCKDGIDSETCVGCPEDEKRKKKHLPTWTRAWDRCAGCRHEEKMSDEEPCSSCFLDDMKFEPAEKKAEPSFRPFKDCDELLKVWNERYQTVFRPRCTMPSVWVRRKEDKSKSSMVTGYGSVGGEPCVNLDGDSFGLAALFEDFEFLDGEPCGVKE